MGFVSKIYQIYTIYYRWPGYCFSNSMIHQRDIYTSGWVFRIVNCYLVTRSNKQYIADIDKNVTLFNYYKRENKRIDCTDVNNWEMWTPKECF